MLAASEGQEASGQIATAPTPPALGPSTIATPAETSASATVRPATAAGAAVQLGAFNGQALGRR